MEQRQPTTGKTRATAESVFGERLLSTRDVGHIFGVAEKTVREWIARGELMAISYGKQWLISETALRESKALKEEQARAEMRLRQRQAQLHTELQRRQRLEPHMAWDLSYCVGCTSALVLTTTYTRDAGRAWCDDCASSPASREALERQVAMQVRERNRRLHEQWAGEQADSGSDTEATGPTICDQWQVYHCPQCGTPQPLSLRDLDNPDFYPWCDQCEPNIRTEDGGYVRTIGDYNLITLEALAAFEAHWRNQSAGSNESSLEAWLVCRCVGCGAQRAVGDRESRLVGDARCRKCAALGAPPLDHHRLALVADAVRAQHGGNPYVFRLRDCEEHQQDDRLVHAPVQVKASEAELILTTCDQFSQDQRVELVTRYAAQYGLSDWATWRLRKWVAPDDSEDLPF